MVLPVPSFPSALFKIPGYLQMAEKVEIQETNPGLQRLNDSGRGSFGDAILGHTGVPGRDEAYIWQAGHDQDAELGL